MLLESRPRPPRGGSELGGPLFVHNVQEWVKLGHPSAAVASAVVSHLHRGLEMRPLARGGEVAAIYHRILTRVVVLRSGSWNAFRRARAVACALT